MLMSLLVVAKMFLATLLVRGALAVAADLVAGNSVAIDLHRCRISVELHDLDGQLSSSLRGLFNLCPDLIELSDFKVVRGHNKLCIASGILDRICEPVFSQSRSCADRDVEPICWTRYANLDGSMVPVFTPHGDYISSSTTLHDPLGHFRQYPEVFWFPLPNMPAGHALQADDPCASAY